MIRRLQTYRTLPGLLATLMMVSVALPVLCQVCAPAEAAAADHTAMHATHESDHDAPAHCLHGHGDAAHGAEAPHDMGACDDAACTMMADEPAPAVLQTERAVPVVQDVLLLAAQAVIQSGAAVSPPDHVQVGKQATPRSPIPIRLQTASFLL
ncbi:MAG: hypothetical protein GVY35_03305 [Bacteroidetes bacterium]|jgi:hypothetical protein|nr:hypothetical protein [Bacteroidota bacterium]